jgi:hypothetical protein
MDMLYPSAVLIVVLDLLAFSNRAEFIGQLKLLGIDMYV